MSKIHPAVVLNENELEFTFITSSGPGGQNVNKVATAAQLRFDVLNSASLSHDVKQRLIKIAGQKITQHGVIVIKAMRHRTRERNKQDALTRLKHMISLANIIPKKRLRTKPTKASKERRLQSKQRQGKLKRERKVIYE